MPQGLSLHIGLNAVDPDHYEGWDGQLTACEADARDMAALSKKRRFKAATLFTQDATSTAVKRAIQDAASALRRGDMFFLTYSGHGGQVPDTNGDEKDHNDETWCLFDREFVDDELYVLWSKFKPGVRIIVLSDSCHSGSVTRGRMYARIMRTTRQGTPPKTKNMPLSVERAVAKKHRRQYEAIQKRNPASARFRVKASVLLISGCADNQLSSDGPRNGLFTGTLLRVLKAKPNTSYHSVHTTLSDQMPPEQSPQLFQVGGADPRFQYLKAFRI